MTTWKQCTERYIALSNILEEYTAKHLKIVKDNTPLKNASIHILEKFHINLICSIDLLKMVDEHPLKFLSLGLVLRGMLSDVINYRYLRKVYDIVGPDLFRSELFVMELDFVRAYRRIVDNEKAMAKGDKAEQEKIDQTFRKGFSDFYKGTNLKSEADFRSKEFWAKIHPYLTGIHVEHSLRISTEAGKMKFIQDQHTERIQILYTYLSQLQHFSGRAYNFYKTREYTSFNPHLTAMLAFFMAIVMISIVNDLNPDKDTVAELIQVAKGITELA